MSQNSDSRVSFRALLRAVRERLLLVQADGGAGLKEGECDIELDDQLPAIVATRYAAVIDNGTARGPNHSSSGGVHDHLFSVKVVLVLRSQHIPRDRKREVVTDRDESLSEMVDRVYQALDFRYEVINRANEIILQETKSAEGFVHPLAWRDTTGAVPVSADVFNASGGLRAGLKKTMVFTDARRITTRSY